MEVRVFVIFGTSLLIGLALNRVWQVSFGLLGPLDLFLSNVFSLVAALLTIVINLLVLYVAISKNSQMLKGAFWATILNTVLLLLFMLLSILFWKCVLGNMDWRAGCKHEDDIAASPFGGMSSVFERPSKGTRMAEDIIHYLLAVAIEAGMAWMLYGCVNRNSMD